MMARPSVSKRQPAAQSSEYSDPEISQISDGQESYISDSQGTEISSGSEGSLTEIEKDQAIGRNLPLKRHSSTAKQVRFGRPLVAIFEPLFDGSIATLSSFVSLFVSLTERVLAPLAVFVVSVFLGLYLTNAVVFGCSSLGTCVGKLTARTQHVPPLWNPKVFLMDERIPSTEFDKITNTQSELVDLLDANGSLLSIMLDRKMHSVERTFKWIRGSDLQPLGKIVFAVDSYSTKASELVREIYSFDRQVHEEAGKIILDTESNIRRFRLRSDWDADVSQRSVTKFLTRARIALFRGVPPRQELFLRYLYTLGTTQQAISRLELEAEKTERRAQWLDELYDEFYELIVTNNKKYRSVKKEDLLGRLLKDLELPGYHQGRLATTEEALVELRTLQGLHQDLINYAAGVVMKVKLLAADVKALRVQGNDNSTTATFEQQFKSMAAATERMSAGLSAVSKRNREQAMMGSSRLEY